jgi:hypothetical protein
MDLSPFLNICDTFLSSRKNIWMFKPSIRNRGRGIETFNFPYEMIEFLKENFENLQ